VDAERKRLARSLRDEIEQIKADVSSRLRMEMKTLRELDRKAREQARPETVFERVVQPLQSIAERDAPREPLRVGDRAEHRRFHMSGQVLSIDGTRARLSTGGKSVEVDAADLIPLREGASKKPDVKRPPTRVPTADLAEPSISAELHLIGKHVDEALEELDRFLDRALLEGRGAVRLIHGFGTGTLRKAVREYLKQHRGVRTFRGGNDREGGDGATIALLDV
jgi:DNA mismatch repair protein MutS2